ncbi:hypothetical protein H7X87_03195 [Acetobacteraceae bacterium]|nr:hypothetical protein [Candidatus Parcubacteria bacterium]
MIKVIPAILPSSYKELEETLARLQGIVSTVQIDVVDGVFAPNRTWPYGKNDTEGFEKLVREDNGMPLWQDFDFEFDLMVTDAAREAPRFLQAGASRLVVHAKSQHAKEALLNLQNVRGEGPGLISLGVALRCDDSPNALWEFEGLYDFVQVMGVEKIGFQGQQFDPRVLELISQLRAAYPTLSLTIDGGVRFENIQKLVDAGINRLIAGSLILSQPDVKVAIREIIATANHTKAGASNV